MTGYGPRPGVDLGRTWVSATASGTTWTGKQKYRLALHKEDGLVKKELGTVVGMDQARETARRVIREALRPAPTVYKIRPWDVGIGEPPSPPPGPSGVSPSADGGR